MIAPAQALALVHAHGSPLPSEQLPLDAALGRVLATDVLATIDHPLWDQSAVDGYALRHADLAAGAPLRLCGQVRAGDEGLEPLAPGTCMRIFTGAPLPPGADTTVMQEHCSRDGDLVTVHDAGLRLGGNVRYHGEQIRAGALALAQGTRLNAAAIGFLASLGVRMVDVHQRPRVRVIVTGDEFAGDEADLRRGKIYESNGQMLMAALGAAGLEGSYVQCADSAEALAEAVAQAAVGCDVLLLTGGVSVGDYDFSRGALEANGFDVIFHNVAQKPGKPLLHCRRGPQAAFGLPGNPRAVMLCYYLYVWPLLAQLEGQAQPGLKQLQLPYAQDHVRKADGKTHFLAGRICAGGFEVLEGQGSHMLQSLAAADLIVACPDTAARSVRGDLATCYLLPWASLGC